MPQIFLIIIFVITQFASTAFAENSAKQPDSLDQINADLMAQKAKNDPFANKKVKVDLESLGLDAIGPNPIAQVPVKEGPSKKFSPVAITPGVAPAPAPKDDVLPVVDPKAVSESIEKTAENTSKEVTDKVQKEGPGVVSKIQYFLHKTADALSSIPTADKKPEDKKNPEAVIVDEASVPNEKYNKAAKKQNSKKAAINKNKVQENEKIRQAKLKKLNELRKKYLIKINKNNEQTDFSDDDEKIVPKEKEISKFVSYEASPPPIVERYRTSDNVHIPIDLTREERIEMLFNTIPNDDISYFKSNYSNVQESNVRNNSGDTILTYAIIMQRHAVVADILSLGADPDMPNSLGYTPLELAIEIADLKSLKLLVDNNANVNYVDALGRTYLMHAARIGYLPAIDLMFSKGIDINAMDVDGFTALSIAYKEKNDMIVKFLLKHGAKTWIEKPYDSSSQSMIKELNGRWKN